MFQRLIALGYHVITIDYRGEGSFPVFPKIVLSGRYFSVIFNFLTSWRSLPSRTDPPLYAEIITLQINKIKYFFLAIRHYVLQLR